MNIFQAKEFIKDTVNLYLKKDEFGEYRIPVVRQRPVFLIGAPGIGKTAIMEQIAQELSIGLVAYSMTHHTRQSALGLPYITHQEFEDATLDVTEYTMSEIISSVYDVMRRSGKREGILFLDEINCVSETLSPSMLQFLQYKTFGRHQVPEGWVIVTAGNPPEYNRSVREFDVVTLDRLKVMEVEPDYETWKTYAQKKGIHNAILTYLELKKEHFYQIETTVRGKNYVTARGWEDLSGIIQMYEAEGLAVSEDLVGQYLRSEKIVREFSAYYDLYNKYRQDYRVEDILNGKVPENAVRRALEAPFDERISLLGMLMDPVLSEMKESMENADFLTELKKVLAVLASVSEKELLLTRLDELASAREKLNLSLLAAGALSDADKHKNLRMSAFFKEAAKNIRSDAGVNASELFDQYVRGAFGELVKAMKTETGRTSERLHRMFEFVDAAFQGGNEMLLLVTELTVGEYSARFLAAFGSDDYKKYSSELMISERQNQFLEEIEKLNL